MFWLIFIVVLLIVVGGLAQVFGKKESGNASVPEADDLSKEEIEYDYLMREEQAQEEEDEYWLEQRNKEEREEE